MLLAQGVKHRSGEPRDRRESSARDKWRNDDGEDLVREAYALGPAGDDGIRPAYAPSFRPG